MKVDCHCHILPEIDDGSWCLEVSAYPGNPAVSVRAKGILKTGLYDMVGTDLHNERYAMFLDRIHFQAEEFNPGH